MTSRSRRCMAALLVVGLALVALRWILPENEVLSRPPGRQATRSERLDGAAAHDPELGDDDPDRAEAGGSSSRRANGIGSGEAGARVRVVRAFGGAPVAHASVRAQPRPRDGWDESFEFEEARDVDRQFVVATDADGFAEFRGLVPGRWTFTASCAGMGRSSASATLAESGDAAEVRILLRSGFGLSGRVLAKDARGIVGATVTVAVASGVLDLRRFESTRSDGAGAFAFAELPEGEATLSATARGAAKVAVTVHLPLQSPIDLVLPPALDAVEGVVVDGSSDEPLPGVEVAVRTSSGGAIARGTTGEDGRFRIPELPSGTLLVVVATKPGWQSTPADGAAQSIAPSSDEAEHVTLRLTRGGRVTGHVLCEGACVAGARVTALTSGVPVSVRSEADGSYVLAGLPDGPCLVYAEYEGLYDAAFPWQEWLLSLSNDTVPPSDLALRNADEHELDRQLQPGGSIEGRVEDERAGAVAGARVFTFGGPFPSAVAVSATSDREGRFVLRGLPPEREIDLFVEADGFVAADPTRLSVASGATRKATLRVFAAPRLRGRVVCDPGPLPPDTTVQVAILGGRRDAMSGPLGEHLLWRTAPVAEVAADGSFEIALGSVRGEFVARASTPGGLEARWPATRFEIGRAVEPIVLELRGSRGVVGQVVDAQGLPLPGTLIDVSGGTPGTIVICFRSVRCVTDESGRFELAGLPPGTYELGASRPGMARTAVRAAIPGTDAVTIVLEPERRISGIVTDPTGASRSGLQVTARLPRPDYEKNWEYAALGARRTISRADGRFTIPGLIDGDYVVEAWEASDRALSVPVARVESVRAGREDVELRTTVDASIAGTVVDGSGRPVPRAELRLATERAPARVVTSSRTDDAGRFALHAPEPGPYLLRAHGRVDGILVSGAAAGIVLGSADVVVTVRHAPVVRGTVVDDAGRPVPALPLLVEGVRVTTSDDGSFEVAVSGADGVAARVDPEDARAWRFALLDATDLRADGGPVRLRLVAKQ